MSKCAVTFQCHCNVRTTYTLSHCPALATHQIAEIVVAVSVLAAVSQRRQVARFRLAVFMQRRLHDAQVHPGSRKIWPRYKTRTTYVITVR